MKIHPDGTLEGTPEELMSYQRTKDVRWLDTRIAGEDERANAISSLTSFYDVIRYSPHAQITIDTGSTRHELKGKRTWIVTEKE